MNELGAFEQAAVSAVGALDGAELRPLPAVQLRLNYFLRPASERQNCLLLIFIANSMCSFIFFILCREGMSVAGALSPAMGYVRPISKKNGEGGHGILSFFKLWFDAYVLSTEVTPFN